MIRQAVLATLFALSSGAAVAQEVARDTGKVGFQNDRLGEMRSIRNHIVPKSANTSDPWGGLSLSHFVTDLNGDGEMEVILRETWSGCVGVACPVYVATYQDGWKQVAGGMGKDVTLGEIGDDGWQDILIDEVNYTWKSKEAGYLVDLSPFGTQIPWEDAETAFDGKEGFLDQVLMRSLGQKYIFMGGVSSESDKIQVGWFDLNYDDQPEYFLRVQAAAICEVECPVFIYTDLESEPFAELTSGSDQVVVSDIEVEGQLRAIYVGTEGGSARLLEWNSDLDRYETTR